MRPHPMEIVYRSVVEDPEHDVPREDFVFGFNFPSPKFSRLKSSAFETEVVWDKRARTIVASIAIENIEFSRWEGIEDFLSQLNREVEPYLTGIHAGTLSAALFEGSTTRYAPAYRFTIVCGHKDCASEVGEVFSQLLFDRAALSLWLTRTVFRYIMVTGDVPAAHERARLLSLEYGRFVMSLIEPAQVQSFPPGLYENVYSRGLDRVH